MLRRIFSLIVAVAILQPTLPALAAELPDAPSASLARVKSDIGNCAREQKKVEVRLNDNKELRGQIREARSEDFVLADQKTGETTRLNYADVAQVRKTGLSTGTKVLIGVGVVAGAAIGIAYVAACTGPGGPHC